MYCLGSFFSKSSDLHSIKARHPLRTDWIVSVLEGTLKILRQKYQELQELNRHAPWSHSWIVGVISVPKLSAKVASRGRIYRAHSFFAASIPVQ
jgi:hypothetical protein